MAVTAVVYRKLTWENFVAACTGAVRTTGLITPPIGSVLFVGAAIGRISIVDVLRTIWPFYLAILGVLLVVAYVPALSLWLPGVLRAAG
jgi:TRAP-type C4-dicarboxylate transport system permease large subunit